MRNERQPPWALLPYERDSIGWRMGAGEEAYDQFYKWFSGLTASERLEFARTNPEPPDWAGFFKMITDHPWIPD